MYIVLDTHDLATITDLFFTSKDSTNLSTDFTQEWYICIYMYWSEKFQKLIEPHTERQGKMVIVTYMHCMLFLYIYLFTIAVLETDYDGGLWTVM